MNSATLAVNVASPVAPAPSPSTTADTSSHARFDAAMEAARADARKPKDAPPGGKATRDDTAHGTPAASKGAKKADEDTAKKDDKNDGDTSIASAMLALIGVPPKPDEAVAKGLGTTKAGAAPLDALDGADDTDTKSALLASLTEEPAGTVDAGHASAAAAPFAALLAGQADGAAADGKDRADGLDPASPMPSLAHAQGNGPLDGPALHVQATQPAATQQFAQELGEQIAWMGSGDIKEARIKLHPEELGSMDVRVNLDGGKVNVAIAVQHPAAVHAVQQTLSQLDSMLAHHGLSLGQADVGQRSEGQGADANAGRTAGQGSEGEPDPDAVVGTGTSHVSRSLLDELA